MKQSVQNKFIQLSYSIWYQSSNRATRAVFPFAPIASFLLGVLFYQTPKLHTNGFIFYSDMICKLDCPPACQY